MKSKTANQLVEAVMHYQKTGNHKQVVINYNPANRTEYKFSGWKHERDHHSPRAILPEDILVSKDGKSINWKWFHANAFELKRLKTPLRWELIPLLEEHL